MAAALSSLRPLFRAAVRAEALPGVGWSSIKPIGTRKLSSTSAAARSRSERPGRIAIQRLDNFQDVS